MRALSPGCGRGSPARVGTSMGPVPYRLLPGMPRQLKAAGESFSKDITIHQSCPWSTIRIEILGSIFGEMEY